MSDLEMGEAVQQSVIPEMLLLIRIYGCCSGVRKLIVRQTVLI